MKRAKVSELKARLSAYLTEVRNGNTVIVCDRNTPIAQVIPFHDNADDFEIREASRPISELFSGNPVPLRKKVNVDKILKETRGER
jgi:prevent-host-death family protein